MNTSNSINSGFVSDYSVGSSMNKERISFLRHSTGDLVLKDLQKKYNLVGASKNEKSNSKELYREFVKIFLKIKFEKLENDHFGQKISQNSIWEEVQRLNITKDNWKDFILNELKDYKKYNKSKR